MRYVYSVVRYVPNPVTGEFVNVGVIAGSDETGDWSLRKAENPRRARLFGPLDSLNAVDAFMNEVGSRLDNFTLMESADISESWLTDMQSRHRNVVQLTVPAPVIADSAEEALDFVFPQVVLEETGAMDVASRAYATRLRLFSELRNSYRKAKIGSGLVRERVPVSAGGVTTNMDFAVGNGEIIQLAHTWSFQISSTSEIARDVKSWGFALERLIEHGGFAQAERRVEIRPHTPVEVVYAAPRTRDQEQVFAEAKRVFDDLAVTAVPQEDVSRVAGDARLQLQRAGVSLETMSE